MSDNDKLHLPNLPKSKTKIIFQNIKPKPTGPHFDFHEICERLNNILLKTDIPGIL